ncbi:MAG: alpha-2-macroglobulin family protein, partial [Hyphomicrobiales bacterium]|nr:alpha-2-macroglobulin family protein [Hyphomicrobiales bacterium]
ATYQDLRDQYGFRLLDYSVDSDAASPRACLQFSENLSKATADFAPFIAVSGIEAPVVTAENASLCVDGLKHGDRYEIMVREGVPSDVGEVLQAPSQIVVYVRDRTPQVRFTGRNYVLPRTGQRGIPVITVNTPVVDVEIYRIGDRSIVNAVLEGEFQSQLDGSAVENLITDRAQKVWTGKMPVEGALNADVTTAFPIDEAVGDLQAGVYVMFAKADGTEDDYWEARPTQWFVVSDLGLASISADDGLHAFMRSLSNAEPLAGVTARLISKSNEVLAERQSDVQGYIRFEAGLVRGEGAAAPALLVAEAANGDYAFLDLSNPGFDLTDRGVAGRPAPGPIDAFVFTERGVYRSGETVHLTALARDAEGRAVKSLPLTITVDRPDGVEQSRYVLEDDGLGGRSLDFNLLDTAMHGTWRIDAFADPKGSAIGSTTFLIDDYVPDRLEITLNSASETAPRSEPVAIDLAGRYLYGAPAAGLKLDGEVVVKVDEEFLDAYPGTYFGITEEEVTPVRRALENLPLTDEAGKAAASVALPPLPATEQPLVADITLRLGEPGGRAVEKTISLPVAAASSAIGIKPDFEDLQIGEGELAGFSVIAVDADGNRTAATGLQWTLVKLETRYQWYNRWGSWEHETLVFTKRIANGTLDVGAADAGRLSQPMEWGRYRLEVASSEPSGPVTSITFDAGWYGGASADSPDMLEVSLDKESYHVGEIARLNLAPRFAGKALIAVVGETTHDLKMIDVPAEGTTVELEVGADWAPGAYATAMLYR